MSEHGKCNLLCKPCMKILKISPRGKRQALQEVIGNIAQHRRVIVFFKKCYCSEQRLCYAECMNVMQTFK